VSADCDGIPIRNFFFDGSQTHLARDVAIFMELARSYKARKKVARVYPAGFPELSGTEPHTPAFA